jgi:hypothetical protein
MVEPKDPVPPVISTVLDDRLVNYDSSLWVERIVDFRRHGLSGTRTPASTNSKGLCCMSGSEGRIIVANGKDALIVGWLARITHNHFQESLYSIHTIFQGQLGSIVLSTLRAMFGH